MAQFDVYEYAGGLPGVTHVLDVQCKGLAMLDTRVVVPLVPEALFGKRLSRVNPVLTVNGQRLVMATSELVAIEKSKLVTAVANLESARHEIKAAYDFIADGF